LYWMGTQLPLPKMGRSPPNLQSMSIVDKWLDVSRCHFGREVGLSPSDIVLDGDPVLLPKRGLSPQFSAHICCDQMAGRIKMPLGMQVGRGPGHIVLDGDLAPPPPKGHSPQFSPHICFGQMAGWIKMPLGRR